MKPPTPYVLGSIGLASFKAAGGSSFLKDVLVEGAYQHPIQPWDTPLLVTKDYIDRVCAATNAAIAGGQRCPVPDGHSNRAKDNIGFASEFTPALVDGKWRAQAKITVEDPAYVAKMGTTIKDVSPLIVPYGLGDGQTFGERIAHVACVPDPVMPGQKDFVACSVESGTVNQVDVPILKTVVTQEPAAMKIKVTDTNVKSLALSGEAVKVGDEVEVAVLEKALNITISKVEAAEKAKAAAEKALAVETAKPAPTVVKMLSVDAKTTPYFTEAQKANAKALSASLDAAQAKGKINAAMRASFEKILSVRHAYALSVEGVAEVVDVAALADSLLASVPDNAAVPLAEQLKKQGAGATERPANEPEGFDSVKAANDMLVKAGLKAAPK